MYPADLITRPCTITHTTTSGSDDMGDPTTTTEDVRTVCELQQASSTEQRETGAVVVTQWVVFLLPDVQASASDGLTVDDMPGAAFTFDGDPWLVRHPTSGEHGHQEARLRQVT